MTYQTDGNNISKSSHSWGGLDSMLLFTHSFTITCYLRIITLNIYKIGDGKNSENVTFKSFLGHIDQQSALKQ